MDNNFHTPVVSILGVGMIGGSLALALKQQGVVDEIIGFGRSHDNLQMARQMGAIDTIAATIKEAVQTADIVVLATPVTRIVSLLQEIEPYLKEDCIITDVGSVKTEILQQAEQILGDKAHRYVAAHPIAGKEKSSIAAAQSDLFVRHKVILTPSADTCATALQSISQMWALTGAMVCTMDAQQHDRLLALTSHLPHVLAYAMMNVFENATDTNDSQQAIAGGFNDFTRIAASDPKMWRDICEMNNSEVCQHLNDYISYLSEVSSMLSQNRYDEIEQLFAEAKQSRLAMSQQQKN